MSALSTEQETAATLKWIKSFNKVTPSTAVKARLLCIHWAGGNGMAFRPWAAQYAPLGIDVLSMHSPGRLQRSKEALVDNIGTIVDTLFMSLKLHGYLDSSIPLIVFGHSLGGIIAFELIKHIERFLPGGSSLRHAVLSSINSPAELLRKYADPTSEVPKKHLMGDDLFIADMHALGGTVGVAEELIRMALPIMRADFKVLETYRPLTRSAVTPYAEMQGIIPADEMVTTAITVMGGYKDHFVTPESCLDWHRFSADAPKDETEISLFYKPDLPKKDDVNTCSPFRIFMDKEGGHFTIFDAEHGGAAWTFGILSQTCLQYHHDPHDESSVLAAPSVPPSS